MRFIIAIDGPAGSGKSTIAKLIAKELKLVYIDTGAMYRMTTLFCLQKGIEINDVEQIKGLLDKFTLDMDVESFYLNGVNVTEEIRGRDVTQYVSKIAAIKEVRKKMVDLQRSIAGEKRVILDGRDIGTVVFPNADLKIYLEAAPEERAKRRLLEYETKGITATYKDVLKEIMERDREDSEREVSPLVKAEDAVAIDSTRYTIDEVKRKVIELIDKAVIDNTLK